MTPKREFLHLNFSNSSQWKCSPLGHHHCPQQHVPLFLIMPFPPFQLKMVLLYQEDMCVLCHFVWLIESRNNAFEITGEEAIMA